MSYAGQLMIEGIEISKTPLLFVALAAWGYYAGKCDILFRRGHLEVFNEVKKNEP
jgi:hypothetical protein